MDKITFLFWVIGLQCVIIAGLTAAFLRVQRRLTDAWEAVEDAEGRYARLMQRIQRQKVEIDFGR